MNEISNLYIYLLLTKTSLYFIKFYHFKEFSHLVTWDIDVHKGNLVLRHTFVKRQRISLNISVRALDIVIITRAIWRPPGELGSNGAHLRVSL